MTYLRWSSELEAGIDVIDHQRERIVDYINQLHHAHATHSREEVREVLDQLIEYTISHFAFEEDLQESAGYTFVKAHKRVHDLFTRKMNAYLERFEQGEDISRELLTTLRTWLVNHIRRDDADYVDCVKELVAASENVRQKQRKKGFFSRFLDS